MLQYNYYNLLGIKSNADEEEITKAFRRQLLKHHPDKNIDNKEEKMKRSMLIVEAYHILKHKQLRQQYDNSLNVSSKRKQGHVQQFNVTLPKGFNVQIQYECQQCFGITLVNIEIAQLFSYMVPCSHCGLRTLFSINHIL